MNILRICKRLFMIFSYYLNFHREKAIFFQGIGHTYCDSSRALSEYIHGKCPAIKLYWELDKDNYKYAPDYVSCVETHSFTAIKRMAQSGVWVLPAEISANSGIWKAPDTFVINTWHGDRGFKAVGRIAAEMMGKDYSKYSVEFANATDLYLAGSDYGEQKARKAFDYKGEISKIGIPRNDKLVYLDKYEQEIVKIKKQLNIDPDTRILLYAPTFRDKEIKNQTVDVDLEQCQQILNMSEKWICLIRAHSRIRHLNFKTNSNIIDVTKYPDMTDLLMISDCLLTDYSSCAGDFILTNKPVILCLFDEKKYTNSRALFVDPHEIGYLIASNQEQLNRLLSDIDKIDNKAVRKKVDSFYGTCESGNSTQILGERIIKHIMKK